MGCSTTSFSGFVWFFAVLGLGVVFGAGYGLWCYFGFGGGLGFELCGLDGYLRFGSYELWN